MNAVVAFAKEFLHPGSMSFLVAMLGIAVALMFVSQRWARSWVIALFVGYWVISSPVGARLLIAPLANPYHSITDVREATGAEAIVILGGGIRSVSVGGETIAALPATAALRTIEGVRLFRLLGGRLPIVASGGRPAPGQRVSDAQVIANALLALHVPQERIIIEDRSMTTHDEALIVPEMLREKGIRRFILVTSPTHMSRSLAVFRAQGADVVPSLSRAIGDQIEEPWFFVPRNESLDVSDEAIYDYAAAVYYWSRGWLKPPEKSR